MTNRRTLYPLILLSAAVTNHGALAEPLVIEEVIVTAQKRAESLQDTAIAITAISNTAFDDLGLSDGADYEALIPSLSVRQNPSRIFIRGIGRVTNQLGTDPGVAFYTDQIYNSETGILLFSDSLTTERIEVLRGPQGTLFGRNATGGAISINSIRPTQEFEHQVRAKVGNYNQLDLGLASSGPISNTMGYRVFAASKTRDGYVENLSGKDIWDLDHQNYGAQISWDTTDNLNVWVNYRRFDTDTYPEAGASSAGYQITPYLTDVLSTTRGLVVNPQYQWDQTNPSVRDPYKVDHDTALHVEYETDQWTTHITWDADAYSIKYIGGYHTTDYQGNDGDFDFTSNPEFQQVAEVSYDNTKTSHELQIISDSDGPLNWVAGLYYYNEELEQPFNIRDRANIRMETVLPLLSFDLNQSHPNPDRVHYQQGSELDIDARAVYADLNYSFSHAYKLTFGLRYSEDEKKGYESLAVVSDPAASIGDIYRNGNFPDNCCGWDLTPEIDSRKLKDDWDNLSGRLVLNYYIDDDAMLYGSISTGYKAGGFAIGALQDDPSFDEESVLSYEIGYKGTLAEVLRINAAVYYYPYDDMQVLAPFVTEEGVTQRGVINADEAEVKGIEVEATWLVTDYLAVMLNYSYIDGEYTDFCCVLDENSAPELGEQDLSGNRLTQSPENKLYTNISYNLQTMDYGDFTFSGSYAWVDERQYEIFGNPETLADSYHRVDAMVSWYSPSSSWRAILSGKNLTEDETFTSLRIRDPYGSVEGTPNAPQTYSLEMQFYF